MKNALTADWDFPTEIVNEDAATLPWMPLPSGRRGRKEIQVVDSNGSLLAALALPPGERPEGSFQAGLQLPRRKRAVR